WTTWTGSVASPHAGAVRLYGFTAAAGAARISGCLSFGTPSRARAYRVALCCPNLTDPFTGSPRRAAAGRGSERITHALDACSRPRRRTGHRRMQRRRTADAGGPAGGCSVTRRDRGALSRARGQRPDAFHGSRRPVHDGHDRAPRAGARDGGAGGDARRQSHDPDAGRADHQRAEGRDRSDAAVAPGSPPARARGAHRGDDDDRAASGRRRPRRPRHARAHARDADGGADPRAGCGTRRGVRSAVPDVHDRAPSGRGHDGARAVRNGWGGPGRGCVPARLGHPGGSDHRDRADGADARRAGRPRRRAVTPAAARTHPGRILTPAKGTAMDFVPSACASGPGRRAGARPSAACLVASLLALAACAPSATTPAAETMPPPRSTPLTPDTDPRIGLGAGLLDAEEAVWNLRVVSKTPPPPEFVGVTNSDLAFTGNYVIQGNYNGFQVWDITNPAKPVLAKGFVCPASQSDVSVYKHLLFVSGEGPGGRLDCGTQGVR